ncbi:site-specific recombinase XerC [Paraburkholderia unamae]|uniref:tyrosine-type recombinase/integrase n=1 Tax=Paraburkholderia unamae TaxID=219649 RepID=UPI000DC391CF|nr:site-specific integrase [Paraburkholderia unamae]RAR47997.1 site-specific recombinase XerC [Paraburkholderia unamae]
MNALEQDLATPANRAERGDGQGWRRELQSIIDRYARKRVNGNVASYRTQELTASVLFAVFGTLNGLGFKLQNPRNLAHRHVEALVRHWHWQGKAVATMQNEISVLRKFALWIGKKGMVTRLADYLPDVPSVELKRTTVSNVSKSWSENGINIDDKIAQADALNERFGLMLRVAIAFGLRRKEILMLRPWKSDQGDHLVIYPNAGPKGGRARIVPIKTTYQREMLDYVKSRLPKGDAMGWKTTRRSKPATLAYNLKEYLRRMEEIGITKDAAGVSGHGLRAEFAENAALTNDTPFVPPTLGGKAGQLPAEDLRHAMGQVSELLGHSRVSVTRSYYGHFEGFRRAPRKVSDEQRAAQSAKSRPVLRGGGTSAPMAVRPGKNGRVAARRRAEALLGVRQMDLPLNDSVVLFKRRTSNAGKDS